MCCPELVRSIPSGPPPPRGPAQGALALGPDVLARLRSVCDLTHPLTADFPVFPAYRPFRATPLFSVERNGFFAQELCYAEHTGTHLDAPAHFYVEGGGTESVHAPDLIAPLAVVSIAGRAARDEDTLLGVDDLLAYERRHGRIPPRAVVALHSGWEARLDQPGHFLNADASGVMHAPGFSPEAAEWLVHERDVAAAATDTLSLDFGPAKVYEAHLALLGAGRYGLENVARLDRVPPAGAVIVVGAPAHRGGSGGPARLLALY
ncbi:MAG TPA: cyclase family protein [Longimicrobium sp.]|jgi:kynurenine formamidase|uniref:cyclase family protein n=1 Tax=Longimicrobium sp. TaxID=2029185 RepID=UPI002ED7EEA5